MIEDERFPTCNVSGCKFLFGHGGRCVFGPTPKLHWEVTEAEADSKELEDLLADGWEPYAVTGGHAPYYVWLRRKTNNG